LQRAAGSGREYYQREGNFTRVPARTGLGLAWLVDEPSPHKEREGAWVGPGFETEVNGQSRSTLVSRPSLVGLLSSLCRYKIFLSCLGCSSRSSTEHFSSPNAFSLDLSSADQAVVPRHLSLNMCLW